MPNANTDPGVMQGAIPLLPRPRDTDHPYERLRHFQDALDYAQRGYQISIQHALHTAGVPAKLWIDAAEAYQAAYQAMLPLEGLPDAESFPRAKDLLHEANHLADEAAAVGGSA